jgi:pimeloyl-ACP methyl ester carboxylesterase
VKIAGRRLEVAWWGASSPRLPIVLLHEGLGSVSMWRGFPEALAERTGRRVMAYSRFGHGHSDLPAVPHTTRFMHEEARLLPGILTAAGIERAIVLGHSDGGSVALVAAAEAPGQIAALVLVAPHVFVEEISIATIRERTLAFADPESDLRRRLSRHHADVDAAFHGWSDVWLDPDFRRWNIEEFLPRVTCPALLIQGEDDQYGTLAQIDAIERQLSGRTGRVMLADCGHSPHRQQREHVLIAVTAFVTPLP